MSDKSKIEWLAGGATWNPIRVRTREDIQIETNSGFKIIPAGTWGYHCERVSPGCKICYACLMNGRTLPAWGTGLDYTVANREKVKVYLDEKEILKPLRWKRPRLIFPCSMTDWCADFVRHEMRAEMYGVMRRCSEHRFLCLTKRADKCVETFLNVEPLAHVWLGFSAENQHYFDERWLHMRKLAAAGWNTWCSFEPLLGPINCTVQGEDFVHNALTGGFQCDGKNEPVETRERLQWGVIGGESGRGARPLNLAWARDLITQFRMAELPVFMKQTGNAPISGSAWSGSFPVKVTGKGSDPEEWPAEFRVRQYPEEMRQS